MLAQNLGFVIVIDHNSIHFMWFSAVIGATLLAILIYFQVNWSLAFVIVVAESKWGFAPLMRSSYHCAIDAIGFVVALLEERISTRKFSNNYQIKVADVKKNIETVQGPDVYPAAQQMLIHQGKVLKDTTTLEENSVAENYFIVIMLSKDLSFNLLSGDILLSKYRGLCNGMSAEVKEQQFGRRALSRYLSAEGPVVFLCAEQYLSGTIPLDIGNYTRLPGLGPFVQPSNRRDTIQHGFLQVATLSLQGNELCSWTDAEILSVIGLI
ncbi:hypothetical protein L6452_03698 [Arctium lappa]|uniref:Uncharacterized protein n=1 Tax=Arctium lappa TaxID=4217 RepID=A0ACB9FPL6_ARCLA|nr:hypothetical protein L6452_03698 [Arctium lappa]